MLKLCLFLAHGLNQTPSQFSRYCYLASERSTGSSEVNDSIPPYQMFSVSFPVYNITDARSIRTNQLVLELE
jgi:hypothetical protein